MKILEKKEKDGRTDVGAIVEGQVCSSRCEIFFAPNIYGHQSLWLIVAMMDVCFGHFFK